MQRHSSNLNYHVESVNYQVSALSDYTKILFAMITSVCLYELMLTSCWLGKFKLPSQSFPSVAACALHEEILNERADKTYPCPFTLQTQSVQTLWVSGGWNTC